MNSPKSTVNKIWSNPVARAKKSRHWSFQPNGRRENRLAKVPAVATLKNHGNGEFSVEINRGKLIERSYKMGRDECKQWAENKGIQALKMGAVKIALAGE